MLYLEDYLEMIEHLPQELRDRFTDMREMDLQVQNAVDTLDERVKAFFANAKRVSTEQQDEECRRICEDYQRVILDAEEKVQIANQIYDLVERYLRKLDQELQKFKIELEADNAGITEILEKRSLELDNTTPTTTTQPPAVTPQPSRHGEKRRASASTYGSVSHSGASQHSSGSGPPENKKQHIDKMHAPEPLIRTNPVTPNALAPPARVASPLSRASSADSTRSADVLVSSGPLGLGSQAIAAAASQAIAATQQMQQGRRSASLKASYEAIAVQNLAAREFTLGSRDIASLTPTAGGAPAAAGAVAVSGTGSGSHSIQTPNTPASGTSSGVSLSSSISALLEAPLATPTSRKSNKKARPSANQTSSANSAAHHLLDSTSDTSTHMNSFGSSTVAATEDPVAADTPAQANAEWQYDPNEPRYCICNQVSYGDMVACDNEGCPFEWFHYPCVNISQPPKGKWFCPQCTASMKRRGKLR
ncbi:inhibitor of growth protein 3-like isoform X2 [Varroa jacobsoni]|uniref:Inhibitor of growth protein n=1 Tax=Varroa destructor TaxID=109461 RepID=A0A7M7JRD9_VARDE|nr:inhibitor of growth protein 3-like isoform X2 [Varroa destructor]XP_022650020.1 inhibitor of growth protein 3-like isoform X2 [Varroa destructor]XP_022650021.1 inhibitor of growth protein 3-like isoform X2 [Varroa destructor]XP_022650022.1 inhibitor of growth protein 3-like isoform X2 [Varroa destructor]XP_022650023.1 inhibitor of growth protein 3-like isoform X2 [Varroa destructor]XP_022650024.1 inhibitor of growth protein 3-like isoform X2 [Varroa destructor]XP_022706312.1 inhibitor of g